MRPEEIPAQIDDIRQIEGIEFVPDLQIDVVSGRRRGTQVDRCLVDRDQNAV